MNRRGFLSGLCAAALAAGARIWPASGVVAVEKVETPAKTLWIDNVWARDYVYTVVREAGESVSDAVIISMRVNPFGDAMAGDLFGNEPARRFQAEQDEYLEQTRARWGCAGFLHA